MRPSQISQNVVAASDPVSAAIEAHLRTLEANGWCELKTSTDPSGVHVSFGESNASGENYDIALLRLADDLLDKAELSGALMGALRRQMMEKAA
jgi:hypothetical protein